MEWFSFNANPTMNVLDTSIIMMQHNPVYYSTDGLRKNLYYYSTQVLQSYSQVRITAVQDDFLLFITTVKVLFTTAQTYLVFFFGVLSCFFEDILSFFFLSSFFFRPSLKSRKRLLLHLWKCVHMWTNACSTHTCTVRI